MRVTAKLMPNCQVRTFVAGIVLFVAHSLSQAANSQAESTQVLTNVNTGTTPTSGFLPRPDWRTLRFSMVAAENVVPLPTDATIVPGGRDHDTTRVPPNEELPWALRHRKAIAYGGMGGIYGGFTIWSYFAWYRTAYLPNFKWGADGLFGAGTYAGGADKLGHFWANLALTRGGAELLQFGGWSPTKAAWTSAAASLALFTLVEVKDGFHYQFSYGDMAANAMGALLGAAQTLSPRFDELFDFRVEFWPSPRYKKKFLAGDVNVAEDYSGQTYLAALHLGGIPALRASRVGTAARLVDVVAGFGSRGYKPDPAAGEPDVTKQELFVGVSLNAQGLFDWLLEDRSCAVDTIRKTLHGTFEIVNVPYTSLPAYTWSRQGT